MTVKIYHNSRCSKSRETYALLEESGVDFETIKYLENPPSAVELDEILTLLGLEPEGLMRKSEAEYKSSGLDNGALNRQEQIALMVTNPKVIERPIVLANGKAIIGRPPQQVLTII